jgi:hypothetical protein
LDSVLTDLMGKSGRAIIEALIAGETNPVKLAGLADRRVSARSRFALITFPNVSPAVILRSCQVSMKPCRLSIDRCVSS